MARDEQRANPKYPIELHSAVRDEVEVMGLPVPIKHKTGSHASPPSDDRANTSPPKRPQPSNMPSSLRVASPQNLAKGTRSPLRQSPEEPLTYSQQRPDSNIPNKAPLLDKRTPTSDLPSSSAGEQNSATIPTHRSMSLPPAPSSHYNSVTSHPGPNASEASAPLASQGTARAPSITNTVTQRVAPDSNETTVAPDAHPTSGSAAQYTSGLPKPEPIDRNNSADPRSSAHVLAQTHTYGAPGSSKYRRRVTSHPSSAPQYHAAAPPEMHVRDTQQRETHPNAESDVDRLISDNEDASDEADCEVATPEADAPNSQTRQPDRRRSMRGEARGGRRNGRTGRPPNINENCLQKRLECVMNVLRNQMTITEACEHYHISPRTYYRWLNSKDRLIELTGGSEANFNSQPTPFARRMPRTNQVNQGPPEEDEEDARRPRVLELHSVRRVSATPIAPASDSQLPTPVGTTGDRVAAATALASHALAKGATPSIEPPPRKRERKVKDNDIQHTAKRTRSTAPHYTHNPQEPHQPLFVEHQVHYNPETGAPVAHGIYERKQHVQAVVIPQAHTLPRAHRQTYSNMPTDLRLQHRQYSHPQPSSHQNVHPHSQMQPISQPQQQSQPQSQPIQQAQSLTQLQSHHHRPPLMNFPAPQIPYSRERDAARAASQATHVVTGNKQPRDVSAGTAAVAPTSHYQYAQGSEYDRAHGTQALAPATAYAYEPGYSQGTVQYTPDNVHPNDSDENEAQSVHHMRGATRIEIMSGRRKVVLNWYSGALTTDIKKAIVRKFGLNRDASWALNNPDHEEVLVSIGMPSGRYYLAVYH